MFLDKEFRREILSFVSDPQVQQFWHKEFPNMNYKSAADGVAPIANKLGAFLAHPVVRKAVCAPEKPLRFRQIMDEGKILLVNLAKGKLGADVSNILGGMIVSNFAHAALVIPPFSTGFRSRIYAAFSSFCFGVIPPMPMLGRSLLYVQSQRVA